jgi:hypothetical protein
MKNHFYNQSLIQTLLHKLGSFLFVYFLVFILSYSVLAYFDLLPNNSGAVAPISDLMLLGIISGVLQVLGYILYIRNPDIDPNPVTWFMFAYGTGILAILEWDASATWPELFLPITCAVFSIYVSYRCWRKSRQNDPIHFWPRDWWPENRSERLAFISDILITIGYITAWVLASLAFLSEEYRTLAVLTFLFLSNVSTFPSFYPLLRETHLHPEREDSAPWFVWTIAYAVLTYITFKTHGAIFHPLMFYPVSNVFLHGLMAWLARKK